MIDVTRGTSTSSAWPGCLKALVKPRETVSGFARTFVGDLLNYFDFEEKRPRISLQPLELVVHASLFLARRRASVSPTVRDCRGNRSSSRSFRDRFEEGC